MVRGLWGRISLLGERGVRVVGSRCGFLAGRVKGEGLEQKLGLCDGDRSIGVVREIEAEEAGGIAVEARGRH